MEKQKFNHACIKCNSTYSSEDIDAYYCESCLAIKNKIAEEVNAKIASRPKKQVKSDWQLLQEQGEMIMSDNGSKIILMGNRNYNGN